MEESRCVGGHHGVRRSPCTRVMPNADLFGRLRAWQSSALVTVAPLPTVWFPPSANVSSVEYVNPRNTDTFDYQGNSPPVRRSWPFTDEPCISTVGPLTVFWNFEQVLVEQLLVVQPLNVCRFNQPVT